jgi:hypothetical protein
MGEAQKLLNSIGVDDLDSGHYYCIDIQTVMDRDLLIDLVISRV